MNTPTSPAVLLGAEKAIEEAAQKIGLVCAACGEEFPDDFAPPGFEYVTLIPQDRDGRTTVRAVQNIVCSRPACAEERAELDSIAMFRRPMMVLWTTLGGDLSPPPKIEQMSKPPEPYELEERP